MSKITWGKQTKLHRPQILRINWGERFQKLEFLASGLIEIFILFPKIKNIYGFDINEDLRKSNIGIY